MAAHEQHSPLQMTQDAAVQWSTAHSEKEVQWSDLSLLALPRAMPSFAKQNQGMDARKTCHVGWGSSIP